MIGLVLVTHGRLAVEFRAALEHVVGAQTQIETISIGPDDNIERRRQDIVDAVQKADDGSGVILLTDMFGGTPSNLAISVMDAGKIVEEGTHEELLKTESGYYKNLYEVQFLTEEAV